MHSTDSGHSDQIDQKPDAPVKELDLKDEAMVPEDAFKDGKYIQEMMIIDDVRPITQPDLPRHLLTYP